MTDTAVRYGNRSTIRSLEWVSEGERFRVKGLKGFDPSWDCGEVLTLTTIATDAAEHFRRGDVGTFDFTLKDIYAEYEGSDAGRTFRTARMVCTGQLLPEWAYRGITTFRVRFEKHNSDDAHPGFAAPAGEPVPGGD